MKKYLLAITFFFAATNSFGYEKSECDGISSWEKIDNNSQDILMRSCNLFGTNFVEVKSQLNENRCIIVKNMKTGDQWKHFYLHKQSIKALATPYIDPKALAVTSKKVENNRCYS